MASSVIILQRFWHYVSWIRGGELLLKFTIFVPQWATQISLFFFNFKNYNKENNLYTYIHINWFIYIHKICFIYIHKNCFIYIHITYIYTKLIVLRLRYSQRSGGDSAGGEESRGKGRQLATSAVNKTQNFVRRWLMLSIRHTKSRLIDFCYPYYIIPIISYYIIILSLII